MVIFRYMEPKQHYGKVTSRQLACSLKAITSGMSQSGVLSIHEVFWVIFIASIDRVLQPTLGACVETRSQDRGGTRCELIRDLELLPIFLRTISSTGDLPFLSTTNDRWAAAGCSRWQESADREG